MRINSHYSKRSYENITLCFIFEMNTKNELLTIFKFHHILNLPFGLTISKYADGKIFEMSWFYKIYTFAIFIFLTIMYFYSNYISLLNIKGIFPSFVNFTITSKISSLILAFIVLNICNIFIGRKSTLNFYNKLFEIEKLLSHDNKNQMCQICKMIFFYICYIVFRASLFTFSYLGFPYYNGIMYDLLSLIIDSETFRFFFEIGYISAKFKLFNHYFGNIITNYQSKSVDFQIHKSISETLWGDLSENNCMKSIDELLYIHNKFYELIEQMNSCYSIKVILTLL